MTADLRAALERIVVWLQAGHPHPGEDVCTARAWDELCGEAQDHERALIAEARAALASTPEPAPVAEGLRYIGGVLHIAKCNGVECSDRIVGECVREAASPSPETEYEPLNKQFCVHGVSETAECVDCGFGWQPSPSPETE